MIIIIVKILEDKFPSYRVYDDARRLEVFDYYRNARTYAREYAKSLGFKKIHYAREVERCPARR